MWAPVNIPEGKTITKVQYYHHSPTGGVTSALLIRAPFGYFGGQTLAVGASNATNSTPVATRIDMPKWGGSADWVIRPGFRYYVAVNMNPGTAVCGFKIVFEWAASGYR
jgi:hypothetical protein